MAEPFYNHHGRALVVLVILLELVVIQRINGNPLHRAALTGQRKLHPRSLENEGKNGPVPSCEKTTYCVETPSYPSDYVASVLSMDQDLKKLATIDVPSDISERMDSTEDGEPLCSSREEMVRPQTALNINQQWLYVVNSPDYVQMLRIEICESEKSSCRIINDFASGYVTMCKQAYVYRKMIAIGLDGSIGPEFFKMPSACKCFVKFTGDPMGRMGVNLGKVKHQQSPVKKFFN